MTKEAKLIEIDPKHKEPLNLRVSMAQRDYFFVWKNYHDFLKSMGMIRNICHGAVPILAFSPVPLG